MTSCKPKETTHTDIPAAADSDTLKDTPVPGLHLLWISDTTLTTAESVLFDPNNNLLYVSCINSVSAGKKDMDGFIARLGLDGKIITRKWVTGLSAPKGMGIDRQTLYVTDIDRLVAIDIASGKITRTWPVKGASFLNDIAVAEDGSVYFTDTNTNTVYALKEGQVITVLMDQQLGGANGVYVEGNQLLVTGSNSGQVYRLDLSTLRVQMVADSIPGGDGVEKYGPGWLVSNWAGEIYHIGATGRITEILDSREARLNAADIEVVEDKRLLLIPTFYGNCLTAYTFVSTEAN